MDIIIGAGISGLSYATATHNDYLILERDTQIGGYCKTIYQGDYIWDYAGHFFHFQHPDIKDFVIANLAASDVLNVKKHTQIYYHGLHIDYPFQMNIHQLDKTEFIDCLYDLFVTDPNAQPHTFKEMLYAKFGRSIAEKFLIPYNEKLYATDLDKLDVDAMGRFFPYANKEQIIHNFKKNEDQSYNASFLYPKQGCIKIVESMASHIDYNRLCLGEWIIDANLDTKTIRTNKRELHYDRLISTMPLPQLLQTCHIDYDPSVYSYNKVLVFNLGFDQKGPERLNNWIYFPDPDLVFYRVGFYDNILSQNKMSLYVEIGFKHDETNIDEDALLQRTLLDLKKCHIVTDQQLVAHCTIIMDPAYVHITRNSESDKKQKMEYLAQHDVYSIGRYGAWKYCSLEDNIHDAFTLAKNI